MREWVRAFKDAYVRSSGVEMPFWPRSRPPTTGTRYFGSSEPTCSSSRDAMSRSHASCGRLPLEMDGFRFISCRMWFTWSKTDENENFCFEIWETCEIAGWDEHGWVRVTETALAETRDSHPTARSSMAKIGGVYRIL